MAFNRAVAVQKRHARVRRKVVGSPQRPRLCLHKSLKHLYAQIIDDERGVTLAAATTNTKALKSEGKSFCNIAFAKKLAAEVVERAKAAGVEAVVFDRGGYRYHGVVKAFGDAARENGLKF